MGIFDALNTRWAACRLNLSPYRTFRATSRIPHHRLQGYQHSFEDLVPMRRRRAGKSQVASRLCATNHHHGGTVSATTVATNMASTAMASLTCRCRPTRSTIRRSSTGNRLHQTRRLSGQCQREPGQRRRLLSDGCSWIRPRKSVAMCLSLAVSEQFVPAQPTTSIQYALNLPTTPSTSASPRGGRQHCGGGRARSR